MKDLAERLRSLAEAIKACEWELPITASEDCVAAANILDGAEADAGRYRWLVEVEPALISAIAWRVDAACKFGLEEVDKAVDAARAAGGNR